MHLNWNIPFLEYTAMVGLNNALNASEGLEHYFTQNAQSECKKSQYKFNINN